MSDVDLKHPLEREPYAMAAFKYDLVAHVYANSSVISKKCWGVTFVAPMCVYIAYNCPLNAKFNVWAIINAKIKCTPNIIKIAVGITVKATFKVASLQFMILIPCKIQADRKIIKPKRHNSPNQVLCNFLGRCFLCFLKSNVIYCI